VGPVRTIDEISDALENQGDANVTKRFGKWHTIFDNYTNHELVTHMYEVGSYGLEVFGYHPERAIHYATKAVLNDTNACSTSDSSVIACPTSTSLEGDH
jgi:hypothetical protein